MISWGLCDGVEIVFLGMRGWWVSKGGSNRRQLCWRENTVFIRNPEPWETARSQEPHGHFWHLREDKNGPRPWEGVVISTQIDLAPSTVSRTRITWNFQSHAQRPQVRITFFSHNHKCRKEQSVHLLLLVCRSSWWNHHGSWPPRWSAQGDTTAWSQRM